MGSKPNIIKRNVTRRRSLSEILLRLDPNNNIPKLMTVFPLALKSEDHPLTKPNYLPTTLSVLNRQNLLNNIKLLVFPAGFLRIDWELDLQLNVPTKPSEYDAKQILPVIQKYLNKNVFPLFPSSLLNQMPNRMVLGVDVVYKSSDKYLAGEAQFAIALDKNLRIFHGTTKFYNPPRDERIEWNLISTKDVNSHFMKFPHLGNALVLYCFDLSAMTNRKIANLKHKDTIKKIQRADRLFRSRKVDFGVHLGHILEKPGTWKGRFTEVFRNKYNINNFVSSSFLRKGEEKRIEQYKFYGGNLDVRAVVMN